MGRLIITPYEGGILSALHDGGRIRLLDWDKPGDEPHCGDIYRARVIGINRNIRAAFVDLGGVNGYLQYDENDAVKAGDELTLQVAKEAVRTKLAAMTRQLSLPGKYLVLLPKERGIRFSRKLMPHEKHEILETVLRPYVADGSFIVRTNAAEAEPDAVAAEAVRLRELAESLSIRAEHTPSPARLYRESEAFLTLARDLRGGEAEEILTDDRQLYEKISGWLTVHQPEDLPKLRLYDDPQLPLRELYGLRTGLEKALAGKVWLKSGGYLVIEATEAMTVVDVNTGKNEGRGDFEETVFRINLEAAEELAVQLRLRNISGIIIVDFINMKEEAHRTQLLTRLAEAVRDDPVHTSVEGMTKLGLMEMTRQKHSQPLAEKLIFLHKNG